jgi:hypothetical protein
MARQRTMQQHIGLRDWKIEFRDAGGDDAGCTTNCLTGVITVGRQCSVTSMLDAIDAAEDYEFPHAPCQTPVLSRGS